jgi:hypothetical protein
MYVHTLIEILSMKFHTQVCIKFLFKVYILYLHT